MAKLTRDMEGIVSMPIDSIQNRFTLQRGQSLRDAGR